MAQAGADYERTTRRHGKWCKLSKSVGRYTLAQGWEGDLRAVRTDQFTQYAHAIAYRDAWLDDQLPAAGSTTGSDRS